LYYISGFGWVEPFSLVLVFFFLFLTAFLLLLAISVSAVVYNVCSLIDELRSCLWLTRQLMFAFAALQSERVVLASGSDQRDATNKRVDRPTRVSWRQPH